MHYVHAVDSWLGLLVFLGVILSQFIAAMRKGRAAQPPSSGASRSRVPAPAARRPVPVPPPEPWRPEPVLVPSRQEAPPAPSLPPRLRERFEEMSVPFQPAPASAFVPPPSGPSEGEIAAAVRRMEEAEGAAAVPAPSASPAWARLGLRARADWQRAFLLSEILQPPVALRPSALARSAHV